MFFKFVLNVLDVTSECAASCVDSFPTLDFKFCDLPKLVDFFFELVLQLKLFISRVSDIFNVFLE